MVKGRLAPFLMQKRVYSHTVSRGTGCADRTDTASTTEDEATPRRLPNACPLLLKAPTELIFQDNCKKKLNHSQLYTSLTWLAK